MFRWLVYAIGSIFVIALMRGVIGIITKGVAQLFEEEAQTGKQSAQSGGGRELIKCPSCGTYFPPGKGITKTMQGATLSFCSEGCRAKLS